MARTYKVHVTLDPDGWLVATVPELRGCHTQARTLEELGERLREAILLATEDDRGDETS